jgi:hypothetical protein
MQDLGYKSHNSIKLLGSLWIFSVLYYVRIFILLPIVMFLSLFFDKCKKHAKDLKEQLFFGEIIMISLQSYFEFLIAGYMNYLFHLQSTNGEYIAYLTCFYSLAVALVVLPFFMLYVMSRPQNVIQSPEFQ